MAVAHENGVAQPSGQPLLGQILLERGLVNDEQLAYALYEAQQTGEAIGEVIVRLGYAQPASIAQALATQHGGPLKSEYGYAVGFAAPSSVPAGEVAPPPVDPTPLVAPPFDVPSFALRTVPLEEQSAEPAAELAPAVVPEVQPEPVVAEALPEPVEAQQAPSVDPELLHLQERVEELAGDLEAARRETRTVAAERSALTVELETVRARVSELELAAADAAAVRAEADAGVAALQERVVELQAALDAAYEQAGRSESDKSALDEARLAVARQNSELARRIEELESSAAASRAEADERSAASDRELAEAASRIAELEAERDDAIAASPSATEKSPDAGGPDYSDSTAHLLFVSGYGGYELLERQGPPPAPGSTVQVALEGGSVTYVVTRVGASPLPGPRLACAYLAAT